jgi:tetrapyrrole methylase family protein / MazG family protein
MESNGTLYGDLNKYLAVLGIQELDNLLILDTGRLDSVEVDGVPIGPRMFPQFPPNLNVILTNIPFDFDFSIFHRSIANLYPADHPIKNLMTLTDGEMAAELTTVSRIQEIQKHPDLAGIFIPALTDDSSFETFEQVVARLRAPEGCPWDREQTHLSLRPHLLEETYETLEAIDRQNPRELEEELGDLLLQIVLNAQIAYEAGDFSMREVIEGINRKIVHRHPHVFKDVRLDGVDGVLRNWEKLKEKERETKGVENEKGLLDGAPKSLPALSLAQEYQDRAARVGFDWPTIDPVLAKVHEELEEVKAAKTEAELSGELGDLLFAVVNVVRWYKVDAESALRGTNLRFAKRFKHIEEQARKNGRKLSEMTLEEMDQFWEEAKTLE